MIIVNIKENNAWVDKTAYIDWASFIIKEVLSHSPDSAEFLIKTYGSKQYEPIIGSEINIYNDIELLFGGYIIEVEKSGTGLSKRLKVKCKDYTHILDRKLVSKTYTGQTGNVIIQDLITTFGSGENITLNGVVANVVVQKISFNYITISQCLSKLATMLGTYDWNIGPDKDIKFFDYTTQSAPFQIDDQGGNFNYNSLNIKTNNTQLRNSIIIRGGITEGSTFTDIKTADGVQKLFFVGVDLTNFQAWIANSSSSSNFVALNVGIDGKDNEVNFDAMYSKDRGYLKFKDTNIPGNNHLIKFSGTPNYPLLTTKSDLVSIQKYGLYEYMIVDKSIKSRLAGSQRATAELLKYSRPQYQITFSTTKDGLRTGQSILINSTFYNINDSFKICGITRSMRTPTTFIYNVELTLSENLNLIDIIKSLLIESQSDQTDISSDEIVDRLYSIIEEMHLEETYNLSKTHNLIQEIINLIESVTSAKNAGTIFVAGPYIPSGPSDTKRVFILNGSRLG